MNKWIKMAQEAIDKLDLLVELLQTNNRLLAALIDLEHR